MIEHLGPYRLERKLAEGGFAQVFAARLMGPGGFERGVALKRLRPEYARSAEAQEQLATEARLSAPISHQNVARLERVERLGDELVLVMELVDGADLFEISRFLERRERRLGVSDSLHVTMELLLALDWVHRLGDSEGRPLGLVHCDVAPSNVMISLAGEVKLLDFGVALGPSLAGLVGRPRGAKLRYLAPEVARGGPPTPRSDLFASALVCWELLAGERIHEGLEPMAVVSAVERGRVPPIRGLRPDVPVSLETVLARALDPDPRRRYSSAEALLLAFEGLGLRSSPFGCRRALAAIARVVRDHRGQRHPGAIELADETSLEAALEDGLS